MEVFKAEADGRTRSSLGVSTKPSDADKPSPGDTPTSGTSGTVEWSKL